MSCFFPWSTHRHNYHDPKVLESLNEIGKNWIKAKTTTGNTVLCEKLVDKHYKQIVNIAFKHLDEDYSRTLRTSADTETALKNCIDRIFIGARELRNKPLDCPTIRPGTPTGERAQIKAEHAMDNVSPENFKTTINHLTEQDFVQFDSLEPLTKQYAYHIHRGNKPVQMKVFIDIPSSEAIPNKPARTLTLVTYSIKPIPMWLGYEAYGLEPLDNDRADPILLFPGTSTEKGITLVADMDPRGVGKILWEQGEENVLKWLEGATKNGTRPAISTGHSMGGAMAQLAGILNERGFIKKVIAFNPPRIGRGPADIWRNQANPTPIINLNHHEDWIPRLGSDRVGDDYIVFDDYISFTTHKENEAENVRNKKATPLIGSHRVIHSTSSALYVRSHVERMLPRWIEVALTVSCFLPALAFLFAWRLILGHDKAYPWTYVLGPCDLALRPLIKYVRQPRNPVPQMT